MSILRAGYLVLAQCLQEAAESLSSNELRGKLSDAVRNSSGDGSYSYYQDHTGDEDSGDCIYNCGSDTMKAPYSKGTDSSDSDYELDTSKAVKVVPRMTYEEQPDEGDHYAAMEAAKLYTKGAVPLCERFVSKKERDAAGSSDFAGKGKSFPILKKEDVSAAAASIGRAGSDNNSTNTIKANIIKIAKAKGWESELPKAWQSGTDATESAPATASGSLKIREMTTRPSEASLDLIESAAGTEMEMKLIAPGKGSSAFYTPEALKQAVADKIFDKGTHIYINHATRAEESERPEGDWHKLVGALSGPAYYSETHRQGPGVYGKAAFASDMVGVIREKAPYTGMSIRANGDAVMESSGRPQLREGVPVLKKFTSAESVDIVTRAGAGGMILTEAAARAAETNGGDMTREEAQRLIESAVAPFRERAVKGDARDEATRLLETVSLPDAAKDRIITRCLENVPMTATNQLDTTKFRESIVKEAQSEGRYIAQLTGSGGVYGMGMQQEPPPDPAQQQRIQESLKLQEANEVAVFTELMGNTEAAKLAARGRAN